MKSLFCGLKAVIFTIVAILCGNAFGATPVAVWDGDFKVSSKTDGNDTYTLAVNGNNVATDGSSITITDTERKGVYINWTQTNADNTLLIRYSNLTLPSNASYPIGIVGFSTSSSVNNDGLAIQTNNGEAKAYWKDTYFYSRKSGVNMKVDGSEAKLAFKYNSTAGTYARTNQRGSWETLYSHDGVKGQGTYAINGAVVGGTRAATITNNGTTYDFQVPTGMKILGIAIFKGVVSDDDIAAYQFPSEKRLADDLMWLPIGDSITEGEQYMGHPDEGTVDTRGGYRYQLWKTMEAAGQPTVTVGYRTGHSGTTEPDDCRWARHAAQYGGVIMHDNNGSHGAAGMNVETTLEVAGYPDVITVLIGVNDCSMTNSSDDQIGKVFVTWVNMIEKLSALRPKSSIFVSTLLPSGQGRATYIDKFNALVRAAAESNASPFNLANVTFADMHKEAFNDEFTASYFKAADALHPNETGAVILANAFAEHLKSAVAARANNAAELVSVDNGTAGFVTVRFNKALKSVTSATLTITGTNVADEEVTLTLEHGTIDETNKRLLKFANSTELKGGTYTATITNLVGNDGNGLALPASLSITDSKFVEILGSGAADNVPASLRNGFVKHGTLAMSDGTVNNGIGSGDNFAGNGPGNQFTTDAALPQYVKRVAYYMELKRPGQPAQFVWASMDASTGFGSRSINVGIPTSTSSNIKALVNNLQVYGNRGNFTNSVIDSEGNSADVGIVEFSPYDWSGNDQSGFPQDFNANYCGWNDTLGSSTLKGCMQIAKVLRTSDFDNYTKPGAQMLFAYNNFNRANTTDIGIGSFTSHRNNAGGTCSVVHDWTDIVSGTGMKAIAVNAYEVKKLEIWTEEGEAPADIYIAAGETVTKSASDPLTLPVRGAGRLVLENYLPTDATILASLQNGTTWTGTVEIKNYTKPDNDNYGIIYFQNYANANSTIALNGVTSTIYTNGSNHPDQTFGKLEIMSGGWTSHNGMYSNNSPLYNCNLTGSGTITINHRGAGIVNFCGDHSNFSGAINFAADADKGVVLAPANTGRTMSGVSARQIFIHANTTVRIAGTVNGTVKIAARNSVTFFDVNAYGNSETTVELMGIGSGYVTAGNPTTSPKIVLSGNVAFTDGFSGKSTTWTEVSGSGNFSVSKSSGGNQNYVISTLKGYTGSITAKSNTTLTIGKVVTALDEVPTTATTIVNFGTDCVADKVLVTGLMICLANGTDVTEDVTVEKTAAGVSIVKTPQPYPEYIDDTDPDQIVAYDDWKAANAEALKLATALQAKEAYFLNCAPTAEEIAKAEEDFKISITIDADGKVTVSAPEGYNVMPVIQGKANLSDKEWTVKTDDNEKNLNFFRAFIEL